jgi:hypothetical protein
MPNDKPSSFIDRLRQPHWRLLRIPLGIALVVGGLFWFLPLVGLWMLPLGLSILAIDFPAAEKASRRSRALARLARARWRKRRGRPPTAPNPATRDDDRERPKKEIASVSHAGASGESADRENGDAARRP